MKRVIESEIKNYIEFLNESDNLDNHINFYNSYNYLKDMEKLSKNGKYYHDNIISSIYYDKNSKPYIVLNNNFFIYLNDSNYYKWIKNINNIRNVNTELINYYNNNLISNIQISNDNKLIYYLNHDEYYNILRYTNYYLYICFSNITSRNGGAEKADTKYKTKIKNIYSPFQKIIENLQYISLKLNNDIYGITSKY